MNKKVISMHFLVLLSTLVCEGQKVEQQAVKKIKL